MKSTYATARRGLTLIELIVVLMILVGLAGILIPAMTSMVGRTHTATASANIASVANAIQRFETQYMSYPDNFDSLMTALTTGDELPSLSTELFAGNLTDPLVEVVLPTDTAAALNEAGITSLGLHLATDGTFDLPNSFDSIADGDVVLGLSATQQVSLGLETIGVANKYVCFGVGTSCTMNGKTMMEAPVHFPENGTANPADVYGRFIAVFQILDGAAPPAALERAKLVAVISPHGDGLGGHIGEYFEIAEQD